VHSYTNLQRPQFGGRGSLGSLIWIDDSADLPVLYSWVLGGDGCGTSPNGGSSVPRCQGYHERDRSTEGTSGGRPAQGGTFGVAGRDGGNDAITLFGSVDRTADAGPAASGREAAARLALTCLRRRGKFRRRDVRIRSAVSGRDREPDQEPN